MKVKYKVLTTDCFSYISNQLLHKNNAGLSNLQLIKKGGRYCIHLFYVYAALSISVSISSILFFLAFLKNMTVNTMVKSNPTINDIFKSRLNPIFSFKI